MNAADPDRLLIAGEFLEQAPPPGEEWLQEHFKSNVQRAFLAYRLTFGNVDLFTEHTGVPHDSSHFNRLEAKLAELRERHRAAKEAFDLDELWRIENGGRRRKGKCGSS